MLRAVVAVFATVGAVLVCVGASPEATSDDRQVTITDLSDQTVGFHYVWAVSRSSIAKLPRWNPLEEEIPLSAHRAARIATEFLRQKFPSPATRLEIFELSLSRVGAGRDYDKPELHDIWGYQIAFHANPNLTPKEKALLNVLVLLDGSVIVPTVSPLK